MLLFYRAAQESLSGTRELYLFFCLFSVFVFLISLFLLIMGEFSLQDKLAYII